MKALAAGPIAFLRHRRWAAAGLLVALGLALPTSAGAASAEIVGCEAEDMAETLAPSVRHSWTAPARRIAGFRFAHRADVACLAGSCLIDSGLAVGGSALDASPAPASDVVLSLDPNPVQESWLVRDRAARALGASLGRAGFLGADGRRHFVWVDYDDVDDAIRLRGRTEIACASEPAECTIRTRVIVFVAYDERTPCGGGARSKPVG